MRQNSESITNFHTGDSHKGRPQFRGDGGNQRWRRKYTGGGGVNM